MRSHLYCFTVTFTVSAIAGCGGGGYGDSDGASGSATCNSITGGGATVTSTGPASNASYSADGNLYSYAYLALTRSSQTGSLRATAQDGIVYPAGSRAGAFVSFINQGSANATTVRTYLDGNLVETANPTNTIFNSTSGGTGAELYTGFVTSAPFDAVEFVETDNGANGTAQYRVYEFCSDGHE